MKALNEATTMQTYIIKWMLGERSVIDLLHDICLKEGEHVHLLSSNKNYVRIRHDGHHYALDCDLACRIKV